jgi:S1-C subfamily serine protease
MPNDFIVSVDGEKIPDSFELLNKIFSLTPNQNATIEFYRKGKKETVTARIGLLPEQSSVSQSGS